MALDFPSSPNVGQVVTVGGVTWTWDGVKWTAAGTGTGIYVPLTGGTMTGDLILNRDAQVALGAATLEQVNARGAGDNRLINGDMRIDQRWNGASSSASNYTVDRWQFIGQPANKVTWGRNYLGANGPSGFPYYLGVQSIAYTALTGDYFLLRQTIEADVISDFNWGTAQAQPVTLSFWAYSSLTGTFSGSLGSLAGARSYPFTYSISAINTWTKISITIPGDIGGAWTMSGNGGGLNLNFDLGSGATFRGPPNAWAGVTYFGATGSVSLVATNAAYLFVTGVKLEIGSVATPYNRQSLAKSLADCQRYYETGTLTASANGTTAAAFVMMGSFNAFKRATPTVTPTNSASSGVNATPNAFTITQQAFAIYHLATATATCSFTDTWIASAEL